MNVRAAISASGVLLSVFSVLALIAALDPKVLMFGLVAVGVGVLWWLLYKGFSGQ